MQPTPDSEPAPQLSDTLPERVNLVRVDEPARPPKSLTALARLLDERRSYAACVAGARQQLARVARELAARQPVLAQEATLRRWLDQPLAADDAPTSTTSADASKDETSTVKQLRNELEQLELAVAKLFATRKPSSKPLVELFHRIEARVDELSRELVELESLVALYSRSAFERWPEPIQMNGVAPAIARLLDPDSLEVDIFHTLRTKLQSFGSRGMNRIGITSPTAGDGKTTVSLGLALTMAQVPGRSVLLIESDLRKPSIECTLGIGRRVGLADWLAGSAGPLPLRQLQPSGLCLMSAGTPSSQPTALLESPRMATLLRIAPELFDTVIVDCPPTWPFPDAAIVQRQVDGFLLVVRSRHTPREQLPSLLGGLQQAALLGVVVNDHERPLSFLYRSGYNKGYGYLPG